MEERQRSITSETDMASTPRAAFTPRTFTPRTLTPRALEGVAEGGGEAVLKEVGAVVHREFMGANLRLDRLAAAVESRVQLSLAELDAKLSFCYQRVVRLKMAPSGPSPVAEVGSLRKPRPPAHHLMEPPSLVSSESGLVVDLPNYKTPQVSSKALSGQTTEPAPQGERRSHKMSVSLQGKEGSVGRIKAMFEK
uniref:Uncharacterized protein n=1 Tax=Haptolina ericina TaxID=156174 RepID=A0A7S3APZ8_9EUKA